MKKYMRKGVVQAVQFTAENGKQIARTSNILLTSTGHLSIYDQYMNTTTVSPGQWIVKDKKENIRIYEPEDFEEEFELI